MTSRDRRALLIGLGIAGIAAGARVVPRYVARIRTAVNQMKDERLILGRMRSQVLGASVVLDSGAALRHRFVALASRILTGSSEAHAISDLTLRLGALSAHTRNLVERTEALPDSTAAGPLRRVTVRLAVEGDAMGTYKLIDEIAADSVVLIISSLRMAATDPASDDTREERIKTELVVSGWYLSEQGKSR